MECRPNNEVEFMSKYLSQQHPNEVIMNQIRLVSSGSDPGLRYLSKADVAHST